MIQNSEESRRRNLVILEPHAVMITRHLLVKLALLLPLSCTRRPIGLHSDNYVGILAGTIRWVSRNCVPSVYQNNSIDKLIKRGARRLTSDYWAMWRIDATRLVRPADGIRYGRVTHCHYWKRALSGKPHCTKVLQLKNINNLRLVSTTPSRRYTFFDWAHIVGRCERDAKQKETIDAGMLRSTRAPKAKPQEFARCYETCVFSIRGYGWSEGTDRLPHLYR